jgi:hypothetical protein
VPFRCIAGGSACIIGAPLSTASNPGGVTRDTWSVARQRRAPAMAAMCGLGRCGRTSRRRLRAILLGRRDRAQPVAPGGGGAPARRDDVAS